MLGPMAPKDPTEKRKGFYVLIDKKVGGMPQDDGSSRHPIFLDDGRLVTFARMVGGISDEYMLSLLETADGFKVLVHSIGVAVTTENPEDEVNFQFNFRRSDATGGSSHEFHIKGDGVEQLIVMNDLQWKKGDNRPGEFLFQMKSIHDLATVTIKLYLNDGFDAPDNDPDPAVDLDSQAYKAMIARSFLSAGNNYRIKKVLEKSRKGEPVTIAFLGGSITQGAGAIPIQDQCYSRQTIEAFRQHYGCGDNVRYVKAGVGGTPSETGIMRYDRDIDRYGTTPPDLVVVEFAVNDSSDELEGGCYESLIGKILDQPQKPAVIMLFAVFANDWNLKDRLAPIGWRYQLPMVNLLEAVSPEFAKPAGQRVLTKRQYFYDQYHPSNLGHRIMADSLLYLLDRLDQEQLSPEFDYQVQPVYTDALRTIRLMDRKDVREDVKLSIGSFTDTDPDLQSVPFDDCFSNTPEFPYNWMQDGKGNEPFTLNLTCKALLLEFKDTSREDFGNAYVSIDGSEPRLIDPREAGWTHCHTTILFMEECSRPHHIEIRMADEAAGKHFTILGFGIVD